VIVLDPRIKVIKDKDGFIKIIIIPGFFIEFKTPQGTGVVSAEQENVLTMLKERGYKTFVVNNLSDAKRIIYEYEKNKALYNGTIEIHPKDYKILLPRLENPTRMIHGIRKSKKTKKKKKKKKSSKRKKVTHDKR